MNPKDVKVGGEVVHNEGPAVLVVIAKCDKKAWVRSLRNQVDYVVSVHSLSPFKRTIKVELDRDDASYFVGTTLMTNEKNLRVRDAIKKALQEQE